MKRFLFVLLPLLLPGGIFGTDIRPEGMETGLVGSVRILDQREIVLSGVGGRHFSEISDLAYLPEEKSLFMVGDEGILFRFRARFGEKILELTPLDAGKIRKKSGRKLKKWRRDTEGLAFDGKGRLFVSFEGKPRIARLSRDGRILGYRRLPAALASEKRLWRRNKGLEALVWHPKYGWVTAAEYPVRAADRKIQTLYALSGKRWSFRRGEDPDSAITALEVLKNGNFLVLERSYSGPLAPYVVTLREVCVDRCRGRALCPTRLLARFDSSEGWLVENFEGLARVGPDRFVMISDDNDSFFQKTVLIYFEVRGR